MVLSKRSDIEFGVAEMLMSFVLLGVVPISGFSSAVLFTQTDPTVVEFRNNLRVDKPVK